MTLASAPSRPYLRTPWFSRAATYLLLFGHATVTPACTEDEGSPPSASSAVGSGSRSSTDATDASDDGRSTRPMIDVQVLLRNDDGEPIVGRSVVAVDSRDRHLEVMSDETGSLFFMGISPPYDIAIAPAPSGAVITPVAYLGLSRQDPQIVLSERLEPAVPAPFRPLRVEVAAPPCPAPTESCWVVATSTSPSGSGHGAAWYGPESTSVVVELMHDASVEPTDVHVLAGEEEGSGFWYAHAPVPDDGNVGPLRLALVDASEPVVFSSLPPDTDVFWNWRLEAWLALPDGSRLLLKRRWWPSFASRVPLLPGALLDVRAAAETSDDDHGPLAARRIAEVRSGLLSLTTPNVILEAPHPAMSVRAGTNVSRRGPGISWTGSEGTSTVVLVDVRRGLQRVRLVTAEREVPFARLAALGIPRPDPGEHSVDIETRVNVTIDAVTSSGTAPTLAPNREPSASTYARFGFLVTP